ncbi:MAG: hypothetical protein K2X82_27135 [Gemmataceae bacterium]|nr:hypothetical protein [Gemmataceae bacterium]
MAAETDRPFLTRPMTLALAGLGTLAAWTTLLPESVRPWNFSAIGAVALFAAARLPLGQAALVLAVALGVKELGGYLAHPEWYTPYPPAWLYFAGYLAAGRLLLRHTESPARIGGTAVGASLLFFLVSNFVSWLEQAQPYGYSLAGLVNCYWAGVPFYRGTFAGDVLYTGVLFGLHAVLSRALFPAERVAVVPVKSS